MIQPINYREKLLKILDASKSIAVITHKSPDGDALGSTFAFFLWLKENFKDKSYKMFIEGIGSGGFTQVPGYEDINWVEDLSDAIKDYDTLVILDLHDYSQMSSDIDKIKDTLKLKTVVFIDHHMGDPEDSCALYISKHLCAACQVLADHVFTKDTDLNEDISKALLLGIMTDSGGFRYIGSNDTSVFNTVPRLLSFAKVTQLDEILMFTEEMPVKAFNVLKALIQNTQNIKLDDLPGITVSYLTPNDIKDLSDEDVRYFRGYYQNLIIRKIKDYPWGLIVAPKESYFSLSFRSSPGGPDLSKLCKEYFSGGGHVRASGGRYPNIGMDIDMSIISEKDMKDIIEKILDTIKSAEITFV